MNQPESPLKIELIYDRDCPNLGPAREVLARALQQLEIAGGWREWERSDVNCPPYARAVGSPTIFINEIDVSPGTSNDSACCRIYPENEEFKGCPRLQDIVAAIRSV